MIAPSHLGRPARPPIRGRSLTSHLIGIVSALFVALLVIVPVTLAADPSTRGERLVITSGADITLPADQTVELFIVYNGTARIEGHASTIVVVNGVANLVGAHADRVLAIQSQVMLDNASHISGDIHAIDSRIGGATAATVTGTVRDLGPEMFFGWRDLGATLLLFYVAFAVSAVLAAVVLAGLAGRQVRAANALILDEPAMVVGAAFLGLIGLLVAGIVALVTVIGIPFGVGLLALVLPGLFFVGYLVAGIGIGDWILRRSSPVIRERPYLAAVVGLTLVGLVSLLPPIGGLVSLIGFGSVVLLSWRVFRGAPRRAPTEGDAGRVAEAAI